MAVELARRYREAGEVDRAGRLERCGCYARTMAWACGDGDPWIARYECGVPGCPTCGPAIARRLARQLCTEMQAISWWGRAHSTELVKRKWRWAMVTLTIQPRYPRDYRAEIRSCLRAAADWYKAAVSWVKASWGAEAAESLGWFVRPEVGARGKVHVHAAWFGPFLPRQLKKSSGEEISGDSGDPLAVRWWREATSRHCGAESCVVDVRAVYASKGKKSKNSLTSSAYELAKYISAPPSKPERKLGLDFRRELSGPEMQESLDRTAAVGLAVMKTADHGATRTLRRRGLMSGKRLKEILELVGAVEDPPVCPECGCHLVIRGGWCSPRLNPLLGSWADPGLAVDGERLRQWMWAGNEGTGPPSGGGGRRSADKAAHSRRRNTGAEAVQTSLF